jgi:hypothetical protein
MQASSAATGDAPPCAWCRSVMTTTVARRRRFCSRKCRQSAFRLRRRSCKDDGATASPGAFHYADPPYPGTSSKYYRDEPSFAGEVDYPALILSLTTSRDKGECLGWALSTSARSLRALLPLCPPEARVCAWVKPIGVSSRTYGLHNTWEPLIVVVGRHRRPGKRDWLRAMPARMEGTLPGRKPIAFCAWLFDLLGMLPGDTLVDLYPGTGIVARAWAERSTMSLAPGGDVVQADRRLSLTPASATSSTPGQRLSSGSGAPAGVVDSGCVAPRGTTEASLVDERDDERNWSP